MPNLYCPCVFKKCAPDATPVLSVCLQEVRRRTWRHDTAAQGGRRAASPARPHPPRSVPERRTRNPPRLAYTNTLELHQLEPAVDAPAHVAPPPPDAPASPKRTRSQASSEDSEGDEHGRRPDAPERLEDRMSINGGARSQAASSPGQIQDDMMGNDSGSEGRGY